MSLQVLQVAALLVSLFFSPFVVAAGVNVTAVCTDPSFNWTFNSIGQSPCLVAAYMISTCYSGAYTLSPLHTGHTYPGPSHDFSNKCQCSTVGYSLIAACVTCQGLKPFYWSEYVANCTSSTILPPSQFPNPVPAGVYVPHWATLDVTNENNWDADKARAAGDRPEYGPGAIFGPHGVYTSSPSAASSTSLSTSSHHGGNAGAIAGGVVGGIAAISIAVAAIFYLRRRRSRAPSAGVSAPKTVLDDGTISQSSPGPPLTMKLYDPNDPTTFPGYQDRQASPDISSGSPVPLSSHVGSGTTLEDSQTSLPAAKEYHDLPMPMC